MAYCKPSFPPHCISDTNVFPRSMSEEISPPSTCVFVTGFYASFMGNLSRDEHQRFLTAQRFIHWDIFNSEFMIIPVNDATQYVSHWFLCVLTRLTDFSSAGNTGCSLLSPMQETHWITINRRHRYTFNILNYQLNWWHSQVNLC